MNRRNMAIFIALLVVLMWAIYCINIYFVGPNMLAKMPSFEKMEPYARIKAKQNYDPFESTKKAIKNQLKHGEANSMRLNPFLWPEEIESLLSSKKIVSRVPDPKPEIQIKPQKLMSKLHVSMISMGKKKKLALLNNRFVAEGSSINDLKVIKITSQNVLLAGKNNKKTLVELESGSMPLMHRFSGKKGSAASKKDQVKGQNKDFLENISEKLTPGKVMQK